MDARARDLVTAADGATSVLAEAAFTARVDGASRRLLAITAAGAGTGPPPPALGTLLGRVVGPGFRAALDEAVPDERDTHSLYFLLLDDLPGAALVSGYALLHADATPALRPHDEFLEAKADLCAGWASDATIMVTIRAQGRSPTPLGPVAPSLDVAGDPLAWHATAPLPPFGMRRQRRLDVGPALPVTGLHPVDVLFRDTHVDTAGIETVVHEYSVSGAVDRATGSITRIDAAPDVLPWMECPAAAASARRLTGRPLAGLRPWVRAEFVGTSTCTHLNDTLRSLTDVEVLLDRTG